MCWIYQCNCIICYLLDFHEDETTGIPAIIILVYITILFPHTKNITYCESTVLQWYTLSHPGLGILRGTQFVHKIIKNDIFQICIRKITNLYAYLFLLSYILKDFYKTNVKIQICNHYTKNCKFLKYKRPKTRFFQLVKDDYFESVFTYIETK